MNKEDSMKTHSKEILIVILIVILLLLYFVGYFGFLIAIIPGIWKWLLAILPLSFGGILIAVCYERIKEIKKGEEDDLSQY